MLSCHSSEIVLCYVLLAKEDLVHRGPSTPPSYSSGPSTPTNYSLGSSRNAECSNCKHLRGKISVLKATMEMHMHLEQHTVNSAALFHEVLNEMEKVDLKNAINNVPAYVEKTEDPDPEAATGTSRNANKFRIQQYLQHEHYALWEVIEFGDSYKAPLEEAGKGVVGEGYVQKKGRTVALTAKDMQKRKNDVKARSTLLLALPDEHQLRFSKYDNAKELWEAILKNFGGNEATKKTKKNQLKQQYGNFKAEGSETLEQTFNRLQAIVSQLEFMDVPIEQDDLNQKFLSSLAPEWLVYTIVWRNRDDLDKMSLDDVYNHLKVYEPEVQKSAGSNSQNMAFISSSNTSSGKGEVPTASVPIGSVTTASIQVSTASTEFTTASLSHDTICAYIATQSNGSQIRYEDITQIDDDDIKEMDIKWNLALLSMRADRFWKKTGKKITIQGSDVAGFDKSKVECFNCHKMGHFARECRAPRSQDRGKRESYRKDPKVEEPAPKALMAIDGIRWD
ncbi:ribonuclease H-like domain-containing protein [Tanacetum coccineum]